MASMEEALTTLLEADAGIGAIAADRIYPDQLPQGVIYPAIRYQRISTPRLKNFAGPAGRARPRFQIDCYAGDKVDVLALATAVRAALDGYSGTSAAVVVDASSAEDEAGGYEEDVRVYRERIDFIFSHTE